MIGPLSRWHQRTFRSLRIENFRRYLIGSTISIIGTWMQFVAQDWLVLKISHSAVALGVASALQFLPVLLLGLWGGVVVDRVDRRRLLLLTQTCSAMLALALGLLTVTDRVSLQLVYLLALALGLVTVFDQPGRQVFLADLVEEGDLLNAQALYSTAYNAGRLLGPALAGVLIASVGIGPAFLVNAVSFLAVLVALALIHRGELRPRAEVRRAPRQVRAALGYVRQRRDLSAALVTVGLVSLLGQNFRVVLPLLAKQELHGDATTYGYLTAALGLGAVAGAVGSAGRARPTLRALLLASLVFGVVNLAASTVASVPWALAAMVALGAANIALNTLARALMLTTSAADVRGRVMSLYTLVFVGSTPFGGVLVGWVCSLTGARGGLLVAAVGGLAPAALLAVPALSSRGARSRSAPEGSWEAGPAQEPPPDYRSAV